MTTNFWLKSFLQLVLVIHGFRLVKYVYGTRCQVLTSWFVVYGIGDKTWDEAQSFCESQGADLATIRGADDTYTLSYLDGDCGQSECWVGAYYDETLSGWYWINTGNTVSSWGTNEPTNSSSGWCGYYLSSSTSTQIYTNKCNSQLNKKSCWFCNGTTPPTNYPTDIPSNVPTNNPSLLPTNNPSLFPTNNPSNSPIFIYIDNIPSNVPTNNPSNTPSFSPSSIPTYNDQDGLSNDTKNNDTENQILYIVIGGMILIIYLLCICFCIFYKKVKIIFESQNKKIKQLESQNQSNLKSNNNIFVTPKDRESSLQGIDLQKPALPNTTSRDPILVEANSNDVNLPPQPSVELNTNNIGEGEAREMSQSEGDGMTDGENDTNGENDINDVSEEKSNVQENRNLVSNELRLEYRVSNNSEMSDDVVIEYDDTTVTKKIDTNLAH